MPKKRPAPPPPYPPEFPRLAWSNWFEPGRRRTPGASIGREQVQAVLSQAEAAPAGRARLNDSVREFERKQIEAALLAAGGNVTQAASRLGLERSQLYKKMRKLGWRPEASGP